MADISLSLLAFVIFIIVVALFIYKDRKKIKFHGILLMRRTEKGKATLDRSVKKHPKMWKFLGTTGLVIAILAMVFVSFIILSTAFATLSGKVSADGPRIVLPADEFSTSPGLFLLPWYFWIIAIAFVVIPHELFHGFLCRLHKVRVKSLGWMLLLVIPGAFVEQHEKDFKKASLRAKLEIAAGGSFANFIFAVIALIINLFIIIALFAPAGMSIGIIDNPNYPAYQANITGYITHINGINTTTYDELVGALDTVKPGDEVLMSTNTGNFTLTAIEHPDKPGKAFIGITQPFYSIHRPVNESTADIANFFEQLFFWMFILALGIGLFNLLPIKPLDGGVMLESAALKLSPNHGKKITIIVSLIFVAAVLISLIGPFLI